ncbi:MobA/MobL family protein, partial [Pseudomonas sp. FW306-2-11AD]|uniref:MobA/MobL family protein n=1 Tax=Pseudomonas sp. FW306-2-11AD TaxID=2070665 RepID=UPI000CB4E7F4
WAGGADGQAKPHAHVMLATREIGPDGFGAKVREWNATALLQQWRERWAEHVNDRLTSLGIEARIDHRSYDTQGIDLEPQHKIGAAGARRLERGEDAERADEHVRIARTNGETIIAQPELGLDALTRQQATFTRRD